MRVLLCCERIVAFVSTQVLRDDSSRADYDDVSPSLSHTHPLSVYLTRTVSSASRSLLSRSRSLPHPDFTLSDALSLHEYTLHPFLSHASLIMSVGHSPMPSHTPSTQTTLPLSHYEPRMKEQRACIRVCQVLLHPERYYTNAYKYYKHRYHQIPVWIVVTGVQCL